ncbi:MAG: STAS domain-containing protein [Comamonadaceae bacterium]|nr:STAS domain-containing protein [Burkholderiales bacterium]MEB2346980.1 STAS domain-containing protein [Comamonadaceae bacterium]
MARGESTRGSLLTKVVRFVRNPTVDWADLDTLDETRESQFSREALKEMIERKRRNDFVRKREFEQLRRLRRKEPAPPTPTGMTSQATSMLQTGEGEERAQTLRKIDAIEQQMARHWIKAADAPAADGATGAATQQPVAPADDASRAYAPTEPLALQPGAAAAPIGGDNAPETLAPGMGASEAMPEEDSGQEIFVHEPDLEEAAILFANADYAGAARCLTAVLEQHAHDDPMQQHEIWMTLFDLYRATGTQEPFDALAIEYAARFGRSAPLWFSLPEQLGVPTRAAPVSAPQRQLGWSAPPTLGVQSVAALQAALERAAQPWTLNWSRVVALDEAAVAPLHALLTRWAGQAVQLRFHGTNALLQVLEAHTIAGERGIDAQWWLLRMALQRVMGQADAFEMTALDYCVTYEVSPPSWVEPRCAYRDDDAPDDQELTATGAQLLVSNEPKASTPMPRAELTGQIEGDAEPQLQPLVALMREGEPFTIACDRLIRIDFAAVGSVLNWAAVQQAQGRELHFHNLHRLVAVFFNVIGVSDHARVEPRRN